MFRHIASPANRPTNRTRNGNIISSMVQMSLSVSCFCVYFQAPLRRPEVMKSSDQIADENGQLLSPRWILHSIALSTLANRNVFKTFSRLDFVRTFPQHVFSLICVIRKAPSAIIDSRFWKFTRVCHGVMQANVTYQPESDWLIFWNCLLNWMQE